MSSVTFSFNLDPVASATTQSAPSTSTESTAEIGAKYDAAKSELHSATDLAGIESPACADGSCFVLHSDGPGVTTLSVGEEDGGVGDYIALPVIDGVEFLQPSVTSFASGGVQDVTTLAIGEEDGGVATASQGIGADVSIGAAEASSSEFTMEPIYDSPRVAQTQQAQLAPLETVPITEPRAKPEGVAFAAAPATTSTVSSALPPIETVPIIEPRLKPTAVASTSSPLPEIKPLDLAGSGVQSAPATVGSGAPIDGNFVSVGDYDSYLASLGGGGASTAVADSASAAAEPVASAVYVPPPLAPIEPFNLSPVTPNNVTVIYSPPPLPPLDPILLTPPAASSGTVVYNPPPASPAEGLGRIEVTLQPASTEPAASIASPAEIEAIATPRIKPASFTTTGPASLAPIQTVPITAAPVESSTVIGSESISAIETGTTVTTFDGPIPSGKPEGAAVEAPRLSDEDFRITTLAYGEEDSGGG